MGEIGQGIARIRGQGPRQASALDRWLRDVESGFEDRALPVTLPVAAAWGRQQYAQPLPVIDALIAATARVHGCWTDPGTGGGPATATAPARARPRMPSTPLVTRLNISK